MIVSGTSPVEVLHTAQELGQHAFVTCVNHENEPGRMRRASFPYDLTCPGEPLPVVTVEFQKQVGSPGRTLDHVAPFPREGNAYE